MRAKSTANVRQMYGKCTDKSGRVCRFSAAAMAAMVATALSQASPSERIIQNSALFFCQNPFYRNQFTRKNSKLLQLDFVPTARDLWVASLPARTTPSSPTLPTPTTLPPSSPTLSTATALPPSSPTLPPASTVANSPTPPPHQNPPQSAPPYPSSLIRCNIPSISSCRTSTPCLMKTKCPAMFLA